MFSFISIELELTAGAWSPLRALPIFGPLQNQNALVAPKFRLAPGQSLGLAVLGATADHHIISRSFYFQGSKSSLRHTNTHPALFPRQTSLPSSSPSPVIHEISALELVCLAKMNFLVMYSRAPCHRHCECKAQQLSEQQTVPALTWRRAVSH